MRLKLLHPMFFVAVATMVATLGGWDIQAADNRPTQLTSPDFPTPSHAAREGRLPEMRHRGPGARPFSLIDLPQSNTVLAPPAQMARIRVQTRLWAGRRFFTAEKTSRGPPHA